MSTESILLLLPEAILVASATLIYVAGACTESRRIWSGAAVAGLVLAGLALLAQVKPQVSPEPLRIDDLSCFARCLALGVGLLFVLLSAQDAAAGQTPEIVGSLLMAIAGLMVTSVANELTLLFLGLELITIPTYVLLYLGRGDRPAQEAAVKYFFLSLLASATLLYGFSFLYGVAGSTNLAALAQRVARVRSGDPDFMLLSLGMVLTLAGLGYKVAAVPFHFYAPDVYQGTTHANAGLLSILPKAAGFFALLRLGAATMPALQGVDGLGWRVTLMLAVLTMTLGNLLALWQQHLRRLLAYSSIAHAGYMLIGVSVWFATGGNLSQLQFDGAAALLTYLALYAVATAGAFAALTYLGRGGRQVDNLEELAGLGRTDPVAGVSLACSMFSLAGIPLLAGFWGKFLLFGGALEVFLLTRQSEGDLAGMGRWFAFLALVGALNAAIAAAYYLRIVGTMFFRPALGRPAGVGARGAFAAMSLASVALVGLGLYSAPVLRHAQKASQALSASYEPAVAVQEPIAVPLAAAER